MTILRTLPVRAALLPFMGWTLLFAVISWCRPTLLRVPKKHCGTSWGVDVGWKTDWGILNAPLQRQGREPESAGAQAATDCAPTSTPAMRYAVGGLGPRR